MAIKLVFIFFFFVNILFAKNFNNKLTSEQLLLLKITYNIGKKTAAKNGMTFEKALSGIVLTETQAGQNIIGDSFDKKHNRRHLLNNSLGPFQIRLSTVRVIQNKIPALYFLKNKSDWYIMNQLLHNYTFGAIIAVNFLKYNYEKTNFNYFKAISRYNGGNNNYIYYNKVLKNIFIIKQMEKKSIFLLKS